MRNFTLALLMLICFSCSAQHEVQQEPLYKKVVVVTEIIGDKAVLQPYGSGISYTVTISKHELVKNWEYVVWLEVSETHPGNRQAVLVKWAITQWQARVIQDKKAKELSGRRIIN